MPSIQIVLDPASYDRLKQIAAAERRTPRMQAEWMLIALLKDADAVRLMLPAERAPQGCPDE